MDKNHHPGCDGKGAFPIGAKANDGEAQAAHALPDDGHFFCPVYGGQIGAYDCDEISCGVKYGWIPNDGLPPLVEMKLIRKKAALCRKCPRYS